MNHQNVPRGAVRPKRCETLPRRRSKLTQIVITVVGIVFILVSILTSQTNEGFVNVLSILMSILIPLLFLVEVSLRFFHAIEEYNHLLTRYENSFYMLIKDVFYFPYSSSIIAVCSVFLFTHIYVKHDQSPLRLWYDLGCNSLLFSFIGALLLHHVYTFECGPLYDSLWIENSNGLDYGSGMAHSFFHGYLKLIIPKTGNGEKYLEELMKDYEDTHHIKLVFYKLFILIPKSLYCPISLMHPEYSPSIEESSSLEPKVQTVAGVQNRVYKNSVYKIKCDDGTKIYVAAEYATPLKTFKDVVSHNGEHATYYKKHKNEIVLQFYLTLKKVLKEHENCTNYCELIFYDDKDENDRYKDVGQVLLRRIRKLERMTQR